MKVSTINTSLNQLPAIFNKFQFDSNTKIINFGCGRYPDNVTVLYPNVVNYDPLYDNKYDQKSKVTTDIEEVLTFANDNENVVVMCANVLNVLTDTQLDEVFDWFSIMYQLNCKIIISVYEGNKTGVQKSTTKGYQRNERTKEYLNRFDFGTIYPHGNIIIIE